MSRKRKVAETENHDRWLVSYADFITLLFAFFVVMFASSQGDKAKAKQVSQSVKEALQEGQVGPMLAGLLGGTIGGRGQGKGETKGKPADAKKVESGNGNPGETVELGPSQRALTSELKLDIDTGKIQIAMEARGLVISLREAPFFPSGDDRVEEEAFASLEKIGAVISVLPNPVRLEGHTDAIPIHTPRFRSNWELSAARAIAMMELFAGRSGVPRQRMAVVGYADTSPVASNDTAEGRARNRRVDVVILNQHGMAPEARPNPAAGHPAPAAAHPAKANGRG